MIWKINLEDEFNHQLVLILYDKLEDQLLIFKL